MIGTKRSIHASKSNHLRLQNFKISWEKMAVKFQMEWTNTQYYGTIHRI